MSQPSSHAPLADRARLKERDENVRFKQSMTPHVSREGLVRWKLEANGNASRLIPRLVGFVCGFGSCGDLLIEHHWTARTHRDAPWCVLLCHSREAVGPVIAIASEAADARAIPAHHQSIAVVLDVMNRERGNGGLSFA
jgi:hypothetical protein